ncbi:MAG TPA: SpoIIE family protein phosphatase [bacterium]|nr:SpoIIE family protein phosphatase [bacterium]
MEAHRFDVGVSCLPYPGQAVAGDMVLIQDQEGVLRVALADGLGHGPEARASAAEAIAAVREQRTPDLAAAFQEAHRRLAHREFRGAVLGLAHFDRARRLVRFAGVGNVDLIILAGDVTRLIGHHGTLGGALPAIRTYEAAFEEGALAFLLSDGITARFDPSAFRDARTLSAQAIAEAVVRTHGRSTDDASAVVVRG